MSRLNRAQAVELVGEDVVAKVEGLSVDFTNRVTDGTNNHGWTEFSASCKTDDADGDTMEIMMYVFVDSDVVANTDDLSDLSWDDAIADAEFEVI